MINNRCMAWKQQVRAVDQRTCKHLQQHLGEEYEKARVGTYTTSSVRPPKVATPPLLLAHSWSPEFFFFYFL